MKDILLNETNDLVIAGGDLVLAASEMQETGCILQSNQGMWKNDPVIGANLIQKEKTNKSRFNMKKRVTIALARDGKDYNRLKREIEKRIR